MSFVQLVKIAVTTLCVMNLSSHVGSRTILAWLPNQQIDAHGYIVPYDEVLKVLQVSSKVGQCYNSTTNGLRQAQGLLYDQK